MRDFIEIGPAPYEEECAQVGEDNYLVKARLECQVYIDQIRREVGSEPEGAKLGIKSFDHDFGQYLEAVVFYDTNNEKAYEYALKCESESPANWDNESKMQLILKARELQLT